MRRILTILLAILILALPYQANFQTFGSQSTGPIVLTTSDNQNVTVYFLDVGQGDSILITTQNKNVLVDGGPETAGQTLLNYLSTYQIQKIDIMIATHSDADHIGGLIPVLQSTIPIQDVVYNGYNHTTQTFNAFKTSALTRNLTIAYRNQVYALTTTINFTVISPTQPLPFTNTNANSIVLKLQVSNTSILLTGDATTDTEQNMLTSGLNLHSQVLKIGHHGSSTSTSQTFLNAVNPTYAIISAGLNNQYGHPTQQTLDRLANNNITTYGTYNQGTIIFTLNPSSPSPTEDPTPTLTPTSPPTTTPTPTITLSPTSAPTENPKPTPIISEFPTLATWLLLIITSSMGLVCLKKKLRQP